jgi:predicted ATP-dependent protease
MSSDPESYECKICGLGNFADKTTLVEHLRSVHEILEVASYAATTMMHEEERDKIAREYFKQLEQIKKEIASG